VLLFIAAGPSIDPSPRPRSPGCFALSHHVLTKDHLVRDARWDDRSGYMGTELRDRTLGVIGFGGIGKALRGNCSPGSA